MAQPKAKITKKKVTLSEEITELKELGNARQEKNDAAFLAGSEKMKTLATKDDLSAVAVEMATAASVKSLHEMLFSLDGSPLFATKADVMPVVNFYQNLMLAAKLTDNGGKWASRLIIGIVATFIAAGVLLGWFKSFIIMLATR